MVPGEPLYNVSGESGASDIQPVCTSYGGMTETLWSRNQPDMYPQAELGRCGERAFPCEIGTHCRYIYGGSYRETLVIGGGRRECGGRVHAECLCESAVYL
jgi:hypothetical protein